MDYLRLYGVAFFLFLSGCYRDGAFDQEVIIRPGANGYTYEVQIKGHWEGRGGNPHNLFDWKLYKWDRSYWIYTNKVDGKIPSSELILTPQWRCVESPWIYRKLMGYVEFGSGKIIVALDLAEYDSDGIVNGYSPMDANGTYTVRTVKEAWKPTTEAEVSNLEQAPCKR
ncbi:MAG: hypothetical protein ABL970_06275 [Nitrospira sp.]